MSGLAGAGPEDSARLLALGELLGRPAIAFDEFPVRKLIRQRRILVTGAGGSIGAELVRQIAALGPAHLTLVENSEFNLYAIDQYLREHRPEVSRSAVFCDIRDRDVLFDWFGAEKPDVVFHAAALKHVPMAEEHPLESMRTNLIGARNVADACTAHGVGVMVFVSTDKAVNPRSVMGAAKRGAEAYCQAMDVEGGATRFVCVRFGNVLGSSGSVAPLFQRQIAEGGPITLTHPDVSRYFMTLGEAVSLLLQAGTLRDMPQDLRGGVYVMDIGDPIRIADLARLMIRMSGKRPEQDIEVRIIGLRPGEKLDEELIHPEEARILRTASGLSLVGPRTQPLAELRRQYDNLQDAIARRDRPTAMAILEALVPDFAPLETDGGELQDAAGA